jgi:ADP-glucose pyrophosphorylase
MWPSHHSRTLTNTYTSTPTHTNTCTLSICLSCMDKLSLCVSLSLYISLCVLIRSAVVDDRVILGRGTTVGAHTRIAQSVLGRDCRIGKCVSE